MNNLDLITYYLEIVSSKSFGGIKLINYFYFIFCFLFFFFINKLLGKFLIKKLFFLLKFNKNQKDFSNKLKKPVSFLIFGIVFFIASQFLYGSENVEIFLHKINSSIFTIVIFWLLSQLISPLFNKLKNLEKILSSDLSDWIISALKIIIFILGFCAVLELWGIRVGPIIAGLGLFGVAVALGAQDLFKNLISGVLVLIEKRFQKGDVVEIQNVIEGSVEKIGFRSTAIRKFDKSLCFIPNNQFAENAVTNITKISNRRINWIIGLEYKSTSIQMKSVCNEIERNILKNKKDFYVSETTPVIVKINAFAPSSIDIMVRCFASTNNYQKFIEIKDRLAISIKEIVEKNKCSFAFPTQSLYIEKN